MERRSILLTLGAVVAAPALAYAQAPAAPLAPAPMGAAPGGAAPMAGGAAMPMGQAEMDHMKRTMTLGAASLMSSRIALKKADIARVKMFAEFEVAEQETIADILKAMQQNDPANAGMPDKPSDSEVMAMLDAEGRQMMDKLQAASGAAFEGDYIQGQLAGHRGLLDAQEDYIRVGRNREHMGVAKLARGQIKEHIAMLEMLQREVRRG